ncbi:MAG: hypothetical protein LBL36_06805 [Clostridiales Family XIII bacterium]|nr:hypothetical protein [Clostridiales Family XIII bacterium]
MKRISLDGKHGVFNATIRLPRMKITRRKVMAVVLTAALLLTFVRAGGTHAEEDSALVSEYARIDETGRGLSAEQTEETPAEESAEVTSDTPAENRDDGMSGESAKVPEVSETPSAAPSQPEHDSVSPRSSNDSADENIARERVADQILNLNSLHVGDFGTGYEVTGDETAQTLVFTAEATGNEYTITQDDNYHDFGQVIVRAGVTTAIAIDGISLVNPTNDASPFALEGTAQVTLILKNENTLRKTAPGTSDNNAALNVPPGAAITISGDGRLIAQGDLESAGIGGGHNEAAGTITISGGTVNAVGGSNGAGIGGGNRGASGTITINGTAEVIARGGSGGAGIGAGGNADTGAGAITITGDAIVTATGSGGSAGLGFGARNQGADVILSIDGEAQVKAYAFNVSTVCPAIQATVYNGSAFLVNARLNVGVTRETALRVSGTGEKQNLTLPTGCANFAYTTGSSPQTGRVTAFVNGTPSGQVVLVSNDSTEIISVNTDAGIKAGIAVKIKSIIGIDLSDSTLRSGSDYTVSGTNPNKQLVLIANREYYIYQSNLSPISNIRVSSGVTATITIDGIDITSSTTSTPTFLLLGTANVTLILENSNTLTQAAAIDGNNAALGVTQNGRITIRGSGSLTAIGGRASAGIGSGYRNATGRITIESGNVTAQGGASGAGIGGGNGGSGGIITMSGGTVTATSVRALTGNNTFGGAGIGSGGGQANGGTITITGSADVTATGGLNMDGDSSGAAIGSGYVAAGNGFCTLAIDASASVKAYAYGRGARAIQSANNDVGYFVNAYFSDTTGFPYPAVHVRLDIYANGGAVKTNELVLPTGYYDFAYTTGSAHTQNDHILAYNANTNNALGSVLLSDNNSREIASVKDAYRAAVKLGSSPGRPSVSAEPAEAVTRTSATFVNTGHDLREPAVFVSGKFQYSLKSDMSDPVDVAWGIDEFTADPIKIPVTGLETNTRYYLQTQLTTSMGIYSSETVSFATLPLITSASAKPGPDGEKTLVSAKFYESTQNNADITGVTVYWSTGTIDADDLDNITASAALYSQTLDSAAFDNAGFSDYAVATAGIQNNILIVAENGSGKAGYAPGVTTLTISNMVAGDYADPTKEFVFTVKFLDTDEVPLADGTKFVYTGSAIIPGVTAPEGGTLTANADGEVSFVLSHGQSIIIAGVASSGSVRITQTEAPVYTVSFTDSENGAPETGFDTGLREMKPNPRSFSFVNTRSAVPDSGIDAGNAGAMLLLPLLALPSLFIFWILRRAYRRHARGNEK